MSKKMTPCEKLGYKVGDKFELVEKSYKFDAGDVVYLQDDDGTGSPYFTNESVKDEYPLGVSCFLSSIKKVAKLKPAKQALADAIHQNGGWCQNADWSSVDRSGLVAFFNGCKPTRDGDEWLDRGDCEYVAGLLGCGVIRMPNWHQRILSRDEYFTAYPGQVKVEIDNETEHKVETEMKSESEVTIKVSDWHKNGELPPVGELCLYVVSDRLSVEVEITAHAKLGICFVQAGQSGESYVSKVAELHRFRPLRTERDKAIDEMVSLVEPLATYKAFACAIYDAGYRKEVK